jgi:hypothetical protein
MKTLFSIGPLRSYLSIASFLRAARNYETQLEINLSKISMRSWLPQRRNLATWGILLRKHDR